MNERIRQLAEQAGITTNIDTDYYERDMNKWVDYFSEKFAELIVQECISIVDDAERGGDNEVWDNAVKFIRRDLKQHFGVEE